MRWGGGDVERTRRFAAELVHLSPDVIFAYAKAQLAPLNDSDRFLRCLGSGRGRVYRELLRARAAISRFTQYEPSMVGKWLGALKEIAPATARVAIVVNPETAPLRGTFYLREFETAATTLGVKPMTNFVHSDTDIEAAALGEEPNSGVIVAPETFTTAHRKLFIALAERNRLPAIYGLRQFPATGGLMSYGPDTVDTIRRAAGYIDRILRGEKPADLPVQAAAKFEFIINAKTAEALGLKLPPALLIRADEVIE